MLPLRGKAVRLKPPTMKSSFYEVTDISDRQPKIFYLGWPKSVINTEENHEYSRINAA